MTPEGYRYSIPITVRFADLDALGHLNHATYLTYMEQARICYVRDVCGWRGFENDWDSLGMILARAEVDYKRPVAFGEAVTVYTRAIRLGGKSFDLQYALYTQTDNNPPQLAAEAVTTMVAFDYDAGQTIPIPADWREKMRVYEPGLRDD
jgi:acyl-CoA thioester hydrolase